MFTNENLHKIHKQKLSLLSKNVLIVLILDDKNNYYIFKTVKILWNRLLLLTLCDIMNKIVALDVR